MSADEPRDWRDLALCAGNPGFEQFPREAVKTCRQCPSLNPCYDEAMRDRDFEGIAGGMQWQVTGRAGTERRGRRVA
jgi:hypothetical protein